MAAERIKIGERLFVVADEETLTFDQDGYLLAACGRAHLIDAELGADESEDDFARRVIMECQESGESSAILAGMLIPIDPETDEPIAWSLEVAAESRVFFGTCRGADRHHLKALLGSTLSHFFEQGVGRLRRSVSSSAAEPDETSSIFDREKTRNGTGSDRKIAATVNGQT